MESKIVNKIERVIIDEELVKHSIIKYLSCIGWGHFNMENSMNMELILNVRKTIILDICQLKPKGHLP